MANFLPILSCNYSFLGGMLKNKVLIFFWECIISMAYGAYNLGGGDNGENSACVSSLYEYYITRFTIL